MRVALLSPRGPLYRHRTGIWKKSLRYMPLTLTTLASLVPPELDVELTLVDEGIRDLDLGIEADLIGISAITGTSARSYELARHFRARGIPVVLGGVHPTLLPEEAAAHADAVVVGYAEQSWPRLLRDFAAGRMARRYDQAPDFTLAGTPFPRRDLLPRREYLTQHTIEATRACTHACEFCVVPTAWGRRPIQRPVGEVVADIRQMGARKVLFLDLNLIGDLAYAKELFTALVPLKIRWAGLTTTMVARDPELLALLERSGCRGLLLGFESLSAESLTETNKEFNTHQEYREVIRRLHDHGIAIQGCFVFGFDHDDRSVFERTAEFVIETRIDLPRFAILTPFPATPLFTRLKAEGRILTENWEHYDGQHVVYRPARMTPDELIDGTRRAWRTAYSLRGIVSRVAGSRLLLPISIPANFGYRFYARNLHRYYTCGAAALA